MNTPVLIIPAYNPDEQLVQLLKEHNRLFSVQCCIVINDGSTPDSALIFKQLDSLGIPVIHHEKNLGKGEALKTGMRYYLKHYAENHCGIVTADADGQHSVADMIKISQALQMQPNKLHLGIRQLTQKNVPFRSRIGNILTRILFNRLTRNQVKDTQTGLRAIPFTLVKEMTSSKARGYEFEFEMFFVAKILKMGIAQTPIQTIYINGNESSHFNPFLDSLKIYYVFIRFCSVALLSFFVDFTIFCAIFYFSNQIIPAMTGARLVSATLNFFLNKNLTFKSDSNLFTAAAKYSLLVLVIGLSSYYLLTLVALTGLNIYYAKIIAELLLFFLSFITQSALIFCKKRLGLSDSILEVS